MIGYKGVVLRNGVLRSKYEDIFEVNVPRETEKVDDGMAFTECGYSFCGTIEDVILHENFILSQVQRKIRDVRLFEIDTLDGHVIGTSYHHKSSKIMLTREIPQEEIIEYFLMNLKAKELMEKALKIDGAGTSVYEEYCTICIEPYRLIEDIDEIEDTYVHSCARLGQKGLCKQILSNGLKVSDCDGCSGFDMALGPRDFEEDYLYLLARRKIKMGLSLDSIDEYLRLAANNSKNEIAGLKLLKTYLTHK